MLHAPDHMLCFKLDSIQQSKSVIFPLGVSYMCRGLFLFFYVLKTNHSQIIAPPVRFF